VLELYDGVVRPEFLAKFLAEDDLLRTFEQSYQDSERLVSEANCWGSVSPQFA
jgi:hypothetical protein